MQKMKPQGLILVELSNAKGAESLRSRSIHTDGLQPCLLRRGRNSGQALVVMLMVIALTVTIAGSAAFRTLSQTRQTKESEDAQKAANAARGIIDKILNNENVDTDMDFGAGNFNTRVTPANIQNLARETHISPLIPKDSQYMFYLHSYDFKTNVFGPRPLNGLSDLEISFLTDGAGCPVLEVIFINDSNAISKRVISGACGSNIVSSDAAANVLTVSAPSVPTITDEDGVSVTFDKSIDVITANSDRMLIIRPLFDGTRLAFSSATLPPQGEIITSQAQSEGGAQSTQKVVRYYPQIPDFFFATSF